MPPLFQRKQSSRCDQMLTDEMWHNAICTEDAFSQRGKFHYRPLCKQDKHLGRERERYDATTGVTLKGPSGLSRSWTNCLSGIRFHGEIQNTSELGICCSKVYGLFSESQTHNSSSTDSKFYSFITVYVRCRHLGLLTRGCWGCSNFPSRKCKLRRCSRFIFQTRTRKFQLHIHSGTHYYCAFYVTENI